MKMLPEASRDQVVAGAVGEDGDLRDAAGDHGGTDLAGPQGSESALVDGVLVSSAAAAATPGLRSVLRESGQGEAHYDRQ